MAWAYEGEEDWMAIVDDAAGLEEEEEEEEEDFFSKKGKKRKMSAMPKAAKRRAPAELAEESYDCSERLEAPEAQSPAFTTVGDIIDLESDGDESLDDLLSQTPAHHVAAHSSAALASIRATKAMLQQAQGTHTGMDLSSPAVPKRKQGEHVELVLRSPKPEIAEMKISAKMSSPLSALIGVYANLNDIEVDDVKLKFDGIRIDPDATPRDLNMRDGDALDVILGVLAQVDLQQVVDNDHVTLKVAVGDGSHKKYRVSKTQTLKRVFDAFCEGQGLTRREVRFMFDGEDLSEDTTPEDEDMETDDIIDTLIKKKKK